MIRLGYITVFAAAVHVLWAIMLVLDPAAKWITAIAFLGHLVSLEVEVAIYAGASAFALLTLFIRHPLWHWLALMPQQIVLVFSAVGAGQAIYLSSFADGVIRPREFIAADQGPWIVLCTIHVLAVWKEVQLWRNERATA